MRNKFLTVIAAVTACVTLFSVNVKAVDLQTALLLQEEATKNYYRMLEQQGVAAQAQIPDTQALAAQQQAAALSQQKMLQDALAAQQKAAQDAVAAQQKAVQDALAAQQKAVAQAQEAALNAQKSALEAASAIQAASLVTPQLDVICDTNCSEQNAMLYAKSVPDFVLVDVSEQRAIFYKNGARVLADNCVTGNAKAGHNTTVGIHQIIFKDLDRTLHGSYGEAFVKYWMRFTKDGQGLHDAGWRRNFGSSIYISNGSHGCVNLPRETAKTIYENSYVGMFVIVEN